VYVCACASQGPYQLFNAASNQKLDRSLCVCVGGGAKCGLVSCIIDGDFMFVGMYLWLRVFMVYKPLV